MSYLRDQKQVRTIANAPADYYWYNPSNCLNLSGYLVFQRQ